MTANYRIVRKELWTIETQNSHGCKKNAQPK